MMKMAAAMGNWWLAASSWQCACSCIMSCAEFFGETSNHLGDWASLQSRFGALWLLAFPKTKITFEREEISGCWWDSGKYTGQLIVIPTKDFAECFEQWKRHWENCVRYHGACFEGDWGPIVLCTMFLISPSINVSIFHITWLDTFWTDLTYQIWLSNVSGSYHFNY